MSEKRFTVMKKFDGSYVICDKGKMLVADDCCDLLNTMSDDIEEVEISIKLFEDDVQIKDKKISEQQSTITELERKLNKYAKIGEEQLKQIIELQETETFTFPPNCDECDFLGGNGICGYCKFTLKCYDSKEDLIDGEVLPNCPLKPLINVLNEQQAIINELKAQLREKEQDERLYADEIVKLNKEAKEVLDFKSLGGDY